MTKKKKKKKEEEEEEEEEEDLFMVLVPFFCVHIDDFLSAWPSYPLLMIHFAMYYLFLCFFFS